MSNNMGTMDIVFVSYNEPAAEEHFRCLKERFPRAKRLHGVNGIERAHKLTANMTDTDHYFIVDGDNLILPTFDFDKVPTPEMPNALIIWSSINDVNGLTYGNGGVKLCSKDGIKSCTNKAMDFILSGNNIVTFNNQIASITRFNMSPYTAWRAAFRECAKLKVGKDISGLDNTSEDWTSKMLSVWTTQGVDRPFGEWCIRGAHDGVTYAVEAQNDPKKLMKINDSDWLQDEYIRRYGSNHIGQTLMSLKL